MTKDMSPRRRTRARPDPGVSAANQTQPAPLSSPEVADSPDYPVGYKKPPGHSRFKAGQSGNPKGRPKSSRNLKTELAEELQELISVREGGTRRTISKQRAMLKGLTAKAVQGDARAANLVLNLVLRLLSQDEDEEQVQLDEADLEILKDLERRAVERARKHKEKKDD